LYFLNSFLQETDIKLIVGLESKLCPAEEIGLEYSREVNKDNSSQFEFFIQINPKVLKELSPDEKVRIYEILRIFSLTDLSGWKYIFEDYNNLLRKRGFRHERYLYLNSLSDSLFAYEIDCILTKGYPSRRNFYRRIFSKYQKNQTSLKDLLLKYFRVKIVKINKKRPKRLVRHKGYRDRGSLGTSDRILEHDIQTDVWLREKENLRKKHLEDFIEFLHGFNGSE
jgi:hypothetical protein